MDDSIIILDDDDEYPSSSTSNLIPALQETKPVLGPYCSPFAPRDSEKQKEVIKLENEKLFSEFVEFCTPLTKDHPEVITFLKSKHTKCSTHFLGSVEFRNMLGHCLQKVQSTRNKVFVYINELCTSLGANSQKRLQTQHSAASNSTDKPQGLKDKGAGKEHTVMSNGSQNTLSETALEQNPDTAQDDARSLKASKRQIRYLENLLKVYANEIHRLQEKELGLDDLCDEDSSYIQEHRLKRKLMKIFEKLCELKGCTSATGRVLEQAICYNGTRYPEINKKLQRFINKPEKYREFPDYSDILREISRANERHELNLSKKQVQTMAQDAFREIGNKLQERSHLDLIYNFGCHLTDNYQADADPALSDHSLSRKLRENRALSVSRIDEIIVKYATMQDETEHEERMKRLEKEKSIQKNEDKDNDSKPIKKECTEKTKDKELVTKNEENYHVKNKESEGEASGKGCEGSEEEEEVEEEEVEEEEEEEEEEEDLSSEPDIEDELEKSIEMRDDSEWADEDGKLEGSDTDQFVELGIESSCSENDMESDNEKKEEQLLKVPDEEEEEEDEEEISEERTTDDKVLDKPSVVTGSASHHSGSSQLDEEGLEESDMAKNGIEKNRPQKVTACYEMDRNQSPSTTSGESNPTVTTEQNHHSFSTQICDSPKATKNKISSSCPLPSDNQNPHPPSPSSQSVSLFTTASTFSSSRKTAKKRKASSSVDLIHTECLDMNGKESRENKPFVSSADEDSIPLDMYVFSSSPPGPDDISPLHAADTTQEECPFSSLVTSSQPSPSSQPSKKKKKVSVATQCDPEEVIILSDSE